MTSSILDLSPGRTELLQSYESIRTRTQELCEPLEREDMVVQTMPDVSPTKWHLAHTTWFFETLVLERHGREYRSFDERYPALFNSYYQSLGTPYPRSRRGLLSRPTVPEVLAYRRHVDEATAALLNEATDEVIARVAPLLSLGMQHEEQHQELLLMDAKHVLAESLLDPVYHSDAKPRAGAAPELEWCRFDGGKTEIGFQGTGFAYDNERPRHEVVLRPFRLASRPVTVGEYRGFIEDGGYERSKLWLADGWDLVQNERWSAPLYWREVEDGWRTMTLNGLRELDDAEPVCHVSFYEADAYATWAKCRLPSEFEWEHAAQSRAISGRFLQSGEFHPRPASASSEEDSPQQLFGDVWEWTSSPYAPYPGYEPFDGALGEYNGKFMINQLVLRGGCCVTPEEHLRTTYRNFYYPHQRWMFSGIRLAK